MKGKINNSYRRKDVNKPVFSVFVAAFKIYNKPAYYIKNTHTIEYISKRERQPAKRKPQTSRKNRIKTITVINFNKFRKLT